MNNAEVIGWAIQDGLRTETEKKVGELQLLEKAPAVKL